MRYNILCVDESGASRLELENLLKNRDIDINILNVRSHTEAIDLVKAGKYRISVAVWAINDMETKVFNWIKAFKREEQGRNIPAVIISDIMDKRHVVKAVESGAAEYILRPYDEAVVLEKFGRILEAASEKAAVKVNYEDIVTYNFFEMLSREMKAASRGAFPLTVMFVSAVPREVNEDRSLNNYMELIGKIIKTKLRDTDVTFQYRADTLAILLPFASCEGADAVTKKIKNIINTHTIIRKMGKGYKPVIVSVTFPEDGRIKSKLLEKLDMKLNDQIKAEKYKSCGIKSTPEPV